jgi:hypothetical protein
MRLRRRRSQADEPVQLIGAPAGPPPDQLTECLRATAARFRELEAVYLFESFVAASGEEPQLAVGLLIAPGSDEARVEKVALGLGDACAAFAPGGDLLFQILSPEALASVSAAVPPGLRSQPVRAHLASRRSSISPSRSRTSGSGAATSIPQASRLLSASGADGRSRGSSVRSSRSRARVSASDCATAPDPRGLHSSWRNPCVVRGTREGDNSLGTVTETRTSSGRRAEKNRPAPRRVQMSTPRAGVVQRLGRRRALPQMQVRFLLPAFTAPGRDPL